MDQLLLRQLAYPREVRKLALPVNLLDVIIHLVRQLLAALLAAVLYDISSTAGFHSGAEAMLTSTTALLWLICSFGHVTATPLRRYGSLTIRSAIIPYGYVMVNPRAISALLPAKAMDYTQPHAPDHRDCQPERWSR